MEVYLDTREASLIEKLQFTTKQLDIGDINISYNDQIKIVIERKTISDLAQSIKDGRYKEQKYRTLEFQKATKCKVVYLFEGFVSFEMDSSKKIFGLEMSTIKNAFINSMFRDNYYIICVKNVNESIAFINTLVDKIKKDPEIYFGNNIENDDYEKCLINSKKKKHITKDNCLLLQIACIPGFSSKNAKSVQDHFEANNMKELISRIEERIEQGIKNPLLEIKGIGKTMSNSLYTMLGIIFKN